MKNLFLIALITLLFACKDNTPATGTFGAAFDQKNAMTLNDALTSYHNGKDTVYTVAGTIENVCQHKGCWYSIKDASGKEFYINNDESFKLPANSKGHKAIAKGKFVKNDKGEESFEMTGVVIE